MRASRTESYRHIIEEAIAEKRVLLLRYNSVERAIQPHILGYDRHGQLGLSAWQIAGTGPGWRLFHVEQMSDLVRTNSHFLKAAAGYNRDDMLFTRILRRV